MDQIRLGFIGAGGIARRHADVLKNFPDVRLAAWSDPVFERAQAFAHDFGGTAYDSFQQMLDSETLDAVYVCVPPFAHGHVETALIERGVPFFVEKPLSADLETAEQIAGAVEQSGLITAVGYHMRYMDTTDEAKELLQRNPARLVVGYWLDSTPPPQWWRHQDQSGGQMVEQTTHIFDLARYLVGEVTSVYAIGSTTERAQFTDLDVFDVSTATLRFASGAVGTLSSTCLLNWNHRTGLHLFGEGLAIELTPWDIMIDIGQGRPVRGQNGDPVEKEDRAFIDAVKGETNRIRAPYSEALLTHRLTQAANRSAVVNQPILLDEAVQA